jgi:hypothetical protein
MYAGNKIGSNPTAFLALLADLTKFKKYVFTGKLFQTMFYIEK